MSSFFESFSFSGPVSGSERVRARLGQEDSSCLPAVNVPSLSLLGEEEEEEDGGEEPSSLSLRPECLAVFKWRTRACFCLPRQIHCGGRLETKSSESVGAEHHYGNQHSGPGCGCSWISV
ncbi:unnamed protein product [Pleuronectes platessa]|uniref:Uncharacterized protein n=1 Tax=Pleuronectes platessa TaxID=8262 RepID=A0A9N7ZEX1_PLEPL|nr:unnamed protein product [Pleuronectes platessa]